MSFSCGISIFTQLQVTHNDMNGCVFCAVKTWQSTYDGRNWEQEPCSVGAPRLGLPLWCGVCANGVVPREGPGGTNRSACVTTRRA
mgnify:CR=1 FL=1